MKATHQKSAVKSTALFIDSVILERSIRIYFLLRLIKAGGLACSTER